MADAIPVHKQESEAVKPKADAKPKDPAAPKGVKVPSHDAVRVDH